MCSHPLLSLGGLRWPSHSSCEPPGNTGRAAPAAAGEHCLGVCFTGMKGLGTWQPADLKHYPSPSVAAFRVTQLILSHELSRWWQKLPSEERDEQLLASSGISRCPRLGEPPLQPRLQRDFCLPREVPGVPTVAQEARQARPWRNAAPRA